MANKIIKFEHFILTAAVSDHFCDKCQLPVICLFMSWNDSSNKFVFYVLKNDIKLILPLTAGEGGLFERCACYLYIS